MLKDVLLKQFLSAHTVKAEGSIIYDGELSSLTQTIDSSIADKRYESIGEDVDYTEYKLNLYGEVFSITIPVFAVEIEKEKIEDISKDYRLLVSDYLKDGLFSDRRGTMIFKILDSFSVGIYEGMVAFYSKVDVSDNLIKNVATNQVNIGTLKAELEINFLNDINRYENIILLFKEVNDGYYDVRRHSIVDKIGTQYQQQEYTLGRDIYVKINSATREVIEVTQEETKYNGEKDKDGWYVLTPEGERINSKDFVPYKTKTDGDITEIRMYGAYTHMLRDLLDFKPLTWQYKFLLNQRRLSFLASCRRAGKTRYLAYGITRSLWRMPNSNKHVQRQVKSLYIAPSEDKQKEVIDYIKTSAERFRILRVLDFNKKENRLYLYDEVIGRNQKVTNTVSSCDFVSAKGFEPGRGKASDEIFIDEGSITPEDTWLNILPIVENEKAKVVVMGTIDWASRRQWFYQWLVESEKGIDDEQYGLRVTIDDIDEELIDTPSKERMKRALKDNKDRYYAELYATFPDNNSVFNTEGFFGLNKERQSFEKIGGYIIGYDPAKRTDIGAIVVGEYRVASSGSTYIQLIEEHSLQGEYANQKDMLASIKNKYTTMALGVPVYVVIDATQVGDVVAEMFGNIIDYKVWYTSKGKRPEIDNYGAWKVPKNHLVHLSQILMEKGIMKGWIGLKELIEQLRNFKAKDTAAGNVRYEAEVGHDDHVNAMMLIGFYVGYVEGRVYDLAIDGEIIRPEGIGEDGLYEEVAHRMETLDSVLGNGYRFGV